MGINYNYENGFPITQRAASAPRLTRAEGSKLKHGSAVRLKRG